MLSSDQPGEVYAAARAIGRVLVDDGTDWHWLADRAVRPAAPQPEAGDWREQCDWLLANADLNTWEARFVASIKHCDTLSPKQRAKLTETFEKYAEVADVAA
jgi:hypothetical protein